ncbi:MAG: hypothetical protein CBD91_07175 [Phycisphaeraceae bacterium TMED231]|nr:MAG: hypothetical protein CBD91_07175 [Phycisphaeraceae bacterium TMED231]
MIRVDVAASRSVRGAISGFRFERTMGANRRDRHHLARRNPQPSPAGDRRRDVAFGPDPRCEW